MFKSCQSIYVTSHRWIFKNFGQGKSPRIKSLFNVSFLLIIMLTTAMLLAQLALQLKWVAAGVGVGIVILLGSVVFLLLNHLVLLNNRWLSNLNHKLAVLSRHNLNALTIMVLVNVIIICGFMLFAAI